MTRALLIVPPFLKYAAGPPLGPAQLVGAGRKAGHDVQVLDLNIALIRSRLPTDLVVAPTGFAGDHDKPRDLLRQMQRGVVQEIQNVGGEVPPSILGEEPVLSLTLSHYEVHRLVKRLVASAVGDFVRQRLRSGVRPDLVGVSVLFSGQVLWGLVVSEVARELWGGVPVVWGGPHVTALKPWIERDHAYGAKVDAFVFGYAERTWVELLDAVGAARAWPAEVGKAGEGPVPDAVAGDDAVPVFGDLQAYGLPRLTLPAQTGRGCFYGRCAYCTYPAVEGSARHVSLQALDAVVQEAQRLSAVVCLKDSLLIPDRLVQVAELIDGRVEWSGCTKLHRRLNVELFTKLAASGCTTLEVGVETLSETAQRLVEKKQALPLLQQVIDAAAATGIGLVVNYITGFPGEDLGGELFLLEHVRRLLDRPDLRAHLEHNTFQLERLAPMARNPGRYGVRVLASWPWASVLAWEPAPLKLVRGGRLPVIGAIA